MTIHKEGRVLLIFLLIMLVAINLGVYYGFPGNDIAFNITLSVSVIIFLLILQFFRHPKVVTFANEKHVVAPADGKVVVIEHTEETEYLKEKRIQISIFMSPVNVHVNRMPVKGMISFFKYHAGKYLVAWHPKSSIENERTSIGIKLSDGTTLLMRQIAGAMARRIKWYVKEGQELEQGQEFGFIKFGSRVDVFLPMDADVKVNIGDKTKAGMTVLAELV